MKRLLYYKDLGLLFFIIRNIIIVNLTPAKDRLRLAEPENITKKRYPLDKLKRYLTFVYFIMGRLWIRPSCFNNSIAVCRMFRKNGFDAKIVFGCNFEKDKLRGHCWVELDEKAALGKFQPIFSYPLCEKTK